MKWKLIPYNRVSELYERHSVTLNFQCVDCGLCDFEACEHVCEQSRKREDEIREPIFTEFLSENIVDHLKDQHEWPTVAVGDVVCITTMHNETQDDLHFGIVFNIPETYKIDGKLDIIYIINSWHGVRQHSFTYNAEFTGWDTWRLTRECIEINKRRRMFTHSVPPTEWDTNS